MNILTMKLQSVYWKLALAESSCHFELMMKLPHKQGCDCLLCKTEHVVL